MNHVAAGRPEACEYAPYYQTYIDRVTGNDPMVALTTQTPLVEALLGRIDPATAKRRYAPDKWSVREVIGHVTDAERVFAFRALWFARRDPSPLPGFDENGWMPAAAYESMPIAQVVGAWRTQRAASLSLLGSFGADAWRLTGTANGKLISVRALAFVIAGHEAHHVAVLRERYGVA